MLIDIMLMALLNKKFGYALPIPVTDYILQSYCLCFPLAKGNKNLVPCGCSQLHLPHPSMLLFCTFSRRGQLYKRKVSMFTSYIYDIYLQTANIFSELSISHYSCIFYHLYLWIMDFENSHELINLEVKECSITLNIHTNLWPRKGTKKKFEFANIN